MNAEALSFSQAFEQDVSFQEIDAFLGALDDLIEEFQSDAPDRRADSEIFARIKGVQDQSSVYYSEDIFKAVQLQQAVTRRLAAHMCENELFALGLASYNEQHSSDNHSHDSSEKVHNESSDKKKKKKETTARFGTSLFFAKKEVVSMNFFERLLGK